MRKFLILIEKVGDTFSAYCPDVPGCAATGASPEQTAAKMRDAIEMHFEGLREDGQRIPEPSTIAEYLEIAF